MDSRASWPWRVALRGTPITGSSVIAAITPGSAAAMPAPAMITRTPRAEAPRAKSATSSGVRWAESASISKGTCIELRKSAAFRITGRSDVLPIIILTEGFISYCELRIRY